MTPTLHPCYALHGRKTALYLDAAYAAVGGNHEAANHLWELHYGGWVAPNIYYLGAAGVVNFAGLRIAGLSGIYNPRHYRLVMPLRFLFCFLLFT